MFRKIFNIHLNRGELNEKQIVVLLSYDGFYFLFRGTNICPSVVIKDA